MIDIFTHKFYELLKDTLNNSFNIDHFYFLFTITVSLLFLEVIYEGWENSSLKKIKEFKSSTRVDFIAWLIATINIFSFFSIIFSFGLCYYLVGLIQKSVGFNLHISNSVLQFIAIFIVSDFKGWISHYIFHKFNSLWQLHSFHHSATNFNILTRQRGHFLESEIKRFFDVIPFVIFGAPISTFFIVAILNETHQMLIHSSSNSEWGFIGRNIINSPAAHKVHHSIESKHHNKNFGITFIFWDIFFKTYHPKSENLTIGIPNNSFNKGYFKDVLLCQFLFFKAVIKSIKERIIIPLHTFTKRTGVFRNEKR
jgi:sterol desaturase/sphingolipid hydroxylase (fatty acid hydroxylase superfamily)